MFEPCFEKEPGRFGARAKATALESDHSPSLVELQTCVTRVAVALYARAAR